MMWLRRHGFAAGGGVAVLLLVLIGAGAPPADLIEAPPPALRTIASAGSGIADLPRENSLPVLPAHQNAPHQLRFTVAEQPFLLIQNRDRIERPGMIQRIVIPKIALDEDVVSIGLVTKDGALHYETPNHVVGQYRGVNPGEGGNVVLAGHVGTRDGRGGQVFRDLHHLGLGDTLALYTDTAQIDYVVTEIRFLAPTNTAVMGPTYHEQLTLITCRNCTTNCHRLVLIAEPLRGQSDV